MNSSRYTLPLTIMLAALLSACGGGANPGPVPQNSSPVIANPGTISIPENTVQVVRLAVSDADGNPVTLTLSGADAAAFSINNDGTIRFAIPADFEAPGDADRNNQYLVTVTADDTYSAKPSLNLVIVVTDVVGDTISNVSANVTTDDTTFIEANILSSFEFPAVMQQQTSKFTLTGAFAQTTNWNNLEYNNPGLAPIAARIGTAAVTTCEIGGADCDSPTGSITIRDFIVTKDSISFLMSGGDGGPGVGVEAILSSNAQVLGTYNPNSCPDPVLKGNQHYVHFDTSDVIGETLRLRIFDETSAGCGFVAFDHFYQTDKAKGPLAAVLTKPLTPVNVTLEGNVAIQKLIAKASFESPVDMVTKRGWVATGAFASPTATSWQGTTVTSAAARVGDKAISTCEMNGNASGCDAPTGTLTSAAFKVTDDYLNFLMAGGNPAGTAPVGLRLTDTVGNVIHTYRPASCGPAFIDGNDDWTAINMVVLKTAFVKAQLFDEEAGGCGFVSTDHWYQSAAAWNPAGTGKNGGTVVLTNTMLATLGFNVTFGADAFTQVIGNFDDAQATAAIWTATGNFANPASADSWRGVSGEARVGARAVSTCELNANANGCDAPVGTLTSPAFTVDAARPFLNFLMAGGNPGGTAPVGLKVLNASDNSVVATFTPNSCGPAAINGDDDWVTIDLVAKVGSQVKVQVFDNEAGGCGFVSFDHLYMSATRQK
jgi:hypothetical protein